MRGPSAFFARLRRYSAGHAQSDGMRVTGNALRKRAMICALTALVLFNGCAVVSVKQKRASDADIARRADVLSTGRLSTDAEASLATAGLVPEICRREPEPCAATLRDAVPEETWLATIAEVRTLRMEAAAEDDALRAAPAIAAHEAIDVARWAYAYLFTTARTPDQRVFESRQERVLRLYNRAVEVAAQALFELARADGRSPADVHAVHNLRLRSVLHGLGDRGGEMPSELLASDTLGFDALRAIYRRDGFGSSLVAVFPRIPEAAAPVADAATIAAISDAAEAIADVDADSTRSATRDGDRAVAAVREAADRSDALAPQPPALQPPFRDTRYLPVTITMRFDGQTQREVLAAEDVTIDVYDPYRYERETIAGRTVPLTANFSAAYGVWLARSELARLSLSSLLRPRQQTVFEPRVYLTQPYDPDKRVVILVHGLASSPEAWVNLANELLGDDELRRHYQVWQVFYPTNLGIFASRQSIDAALRATFAHFDTDGDNRASHDAVLVGHSMGGVIARLLVSDSGGAVLARALENLPPAQAQALAAEPLVQGLTKFRPLPQVGRVVFLATPHRGADMSDAWLPRLVRRVIRLPFDVLRDAGDVLQRAQVDEQTQTQLGFRKGRPPTGPDDLSPNSLFMRSTAGLPIEAGLPYHSIIAQRNPAIALPSSDDGVVPYASAHLDGAQSERVVHSEHSVQETPEAILELRRILRLHMAGDTPPPCWTFSGCAGSAQL